MEGLLDLLPNLLPLYALIGLGFIAGRWLDVNLHSVARINIFILLPIVMFGAIVKMDFNPTYILLPIALWGVSTSIAMGSYKALQKFWHDGSANLVGAGGVNGNAIYFGLPLIMTLFGPEMAGIYLFMNLGPQINNITLAYFITARGKYNIADSYKKLLRFPALYATCLAIIINLSGGSLPDVGLQYWQYAAGSITFLGMMMIGIALGKLDRIAFDAKLVAALFVSKFLIWPLACLALITLDQTVFKLFDLEVYQIFLIFSVMPLIGNLVAYAAEYNLHPERAAAAVLVSTLFTLISIPAIFVVMKLIGIGII